jgi:hypothetical protein
MNDHELMEKCDQFLTEWIKKRDTPNDFDDITYVMRDFVKWLIAQGLLK